MGLLSILKKVKEQERELRILILGLDNAGKTTIVKSLTGQSLDDVEPTLGFQIHSLEFLDYQLNLWDIGGQSSIRAYWRNYFEQTDGIVWVIDSSDVSRLGMVRGELDKVLQQERLAGASLLIWANKQDLEGSLSMEEIAKALQLRMHSDRNDHDSSSTTPTSVEDMPKNEIGNDFNRHWSIQACSAMTGQGLLEGMEWLIKDIGERIFMLS